MVRSITSTRLVSVEFRLTGMQAGDEDRYHEVLGALGLLGHESQFPQLKKVIFVPGIGFKDKHPTAHRDLLCSWFPVLHQRGILYIGGLRSSELS